jgi:dipeptidyl aminopeptidase/acylaminoacyl peptidase
VAALVPGTLLGPVELDAQPRTLEVDDLGLDVGLSGQALSPDGLSVVVVTSRPNYDDNRFDRSLILVDVVTGAGRDLTPHRPQVGQPRWSPAGDRLAFLDVGESGDQRQVFVLPMNGGEARQITEAERGVQLFRWTTDGAHLLYTTADTREELEGEERHNRSFEVGDNSYLTREAPTSTHLWRIPIEGGEPERLTEGPENHSDVLLSPDGRTVALEVTPHPHSGEGIRSFIRLLDLETGERGDLAIDPPVYPAVFSPDGRYLAYSRSRGPEPYFNPSGIFLQPLERGTASTETAIDVTVRIDRSLGGVGWLPDGESLLVTGTDLTRRAMWHVGLDGEPSRLDLGTVHPTSRPDIGPDGTVAFIGREVDRPSELYVMKIGEWKPRRLTNFNEAIASMHLGTVETVTWDGPDGFEQNGVLVYPPDYQEDQQYPLVLSIHGGPMGTSTEVFNTFNQIMAAQGSRAARLWMRAAWLSPGGRTGAT